MTSATTASNGPLRCLLAASALALALAAVGGTAVTPAATAAPAAEAHASEAAAAGGEAASAPLTDERAAATSAATTRQQVLQRAATWLTGHNGKPVPYSQSAYHNGYRTDCSGYASMALGLPKPGTNTVGLASSSISTRIGMNQLKPGDLVIDAKGTNTTRHVVIFEKWNDAAHTSYTAYEQRGTYGTSHRTVKYGIGADEYDAYRPKVLG